MVKAWFHIYYPQDNRKSKPTLINQHPPPPNLNQVLQCHETFLPDVRLQNCLVILKNRGWGCFFPIFVSGLVKTSVCVHLSDELVKVLKMKPTPKWKEKFENYLSTMPNYYAGVSDRNNCCFKLYSNLIVHM